MEVLTMGIGILMLAGIIILATGMLGTLGVFLSNHQEEDVPIKIRISPG